MSTACPVTNHRGLSFLRKFEDEVQKNVTRYGLPLIEKVQQKNFPDEE